MSWYVVCKWVGLSWVFLKFLAFEEFMNNVVQICGENINCWSGRLKVRSSHSDTFCGRDVSLWCHMAPQTLVNIGSGNQATSHYLNQCWSCGIRLKVIALEMLIKVITTLHWFETHTFKVKATSPRGQWVNRVLCLCLHDLGKDESIESGFLFQNEY